MRKILTLSILLVFFAAISFAGIEQQRYTISGTVKDESNGESLIGASVVVKERNVGIVTNTYGFYSLTLPEGKYTLFISYIGYQAEEIFLTLDGDRQLSVNLSPSASLLEGVEVTAEAINRHIITPQMSVQRLNTETIKNIPALFGEVDVIKALQLLPGVQSTSEGSSGFSVRGGSPDQNLILLDEALVYNASHIAGFFSVFNNDAIKDIQLYKGDIPVQHGGRLSSLLEIHMKDGNSKNWQGAGGIGTISSRLTVDGPVIEDKLTFLASGRRTYADLLLMFSDDEALRDNKLYFYDLNAKISWDINENNRLFISGYGGRDVFENPYASFGFGNATGTVRWNHFFSNKLFANFMFLYSKYDYELGTPESEPSSFLWNYDMRDYSGKMDFTYYLNPYNTIRFGVISTNHLFNPGLIQGMGEDNYLNELRLPLQNSMEYGIYLSNEQKIGNRFITRYGIRLSAFQNMGEAIVYTYDDAYQVHDSIQVGKNNIYNTYINPEPRISGTYIMNENNSLKASYSRTVQYVQVASNATGGTPLDIWFTANNNVKPQLSDQFGLGYFRNFFDHRLETSVELFYKKMQNTIDFRDYAELIFNQHLDAEIRIGESRAYGVELLLQKPHGKLNGWISYTYSRTTRTIPELNEGNPYPAPYDRPHDVSVVLSYHITPRLVSSVNWVYATGNPVTFPVGRYEYGGKIVPVYAERNSYRMPHYHRMDVSLTWKINRNPSLAKFRQELNLSVYNVYNRHNAWAINFSQDDEDPNKTIATKTYLFPILPSLTYNFYF